MTLRALAISGSPRPQGNTVALLNHCLNRLKTHGIQTELVSLHDKDLHGCDGCGACGETKDGTCPSISDDFGLIYDQMLKAEILIVGSPVYFGSATPSLMGLLERAGYVARRNGQPFSRKIGGPIAVARRAGQNFTYAQLAFWYTINDMILVGSTYWNVAVARDPGDIEKDAEGLQTIERFADNLAFVGKKLF